MLSSNTVAMSSQRSADTVNPAGTSYSHSDKISLSYMFESEYLQGSVAYKELRWELP